MRSLLDGLDVRPRDGVAVEEGEELAEGVKKRPVWEQTDGLVGVDGALGGAAAAAAADGMVRGGAVQAQAGSLLISQTLLREGLVELDGGAVDLKHKWSHDLSEGCTTPSRPTTSNLAITASRDSKWDRLVYVPSKCVKGPKKASVSRRRM